MSRILKANLNALGLEVDAIRADLRAASALAIPSQHGLLEKAGGAPSSAGLVDATNIVLDPQGLGVAVVQSDSLIGTWDHALVDASIVPVDGIAPAGWQRAMEVTSSDPAGFGGVRFQVTQDGTHYWYALVKVDSASTPGIVGIMNGVTPVPEATVTIPDGFGDSWWLVGGQLDIIVDRPVHRVFVQAAHAWITGATVSPLVDPGGPFSGDSPATERYLYSWQGQRNNSISLRRGQTVDLLALREQTAQLDIAPAGLTVEQRRAYLLARRKARHHGDGATFVQLIVEMIRTEDPTFQATDVRVVTDYEAASIRLQIAYNPSGDLAARITRLIDDIKPYPIPVDSIVWGTFRADISQADVDAVG